MLRILLNDCIDGVWEREVLFLATMSEDFERKDDGFDVMYISTPGSTTPREESRSSQD